MKIILWISSLILFAGCSGFAPATPQGRLIVFGDSFSSMPGSFAWQLGPALNLIE